ncbi:MAG: PP2C family protein-serine/threonine phosphatase [Verrucomicrobiota bacterium]
MGLTRDKELELARRIQEHTQPRHVSEVPGYLVFAKTIPATWGNGDFFDIIGVRPRDDRRGYVMDRSPHVDHLVLSLGDATGHGMGAALMATSLTAMLRTSIRLGVYHRDLISALNTQLFEDFPDDHFITFLLGRLDRARNMFRWVSFGQGPLWLYRAGEDNVESLEPHHPPLGVLPEVLEYRPTETLLEPGDTLLAISDGFPETSNPQEELLGEQALMEEFHRVARNAPERIFQTLWDRIQSHAGGLPQGDDRTFLLIRRLA